MKKSTLLVVLLCCCLSVPALGQRGFRDFSDVEDTPPPKPTVQTPPPPSAPPIGESEKKAPPPPVPIEKDSAPTNGKNDKPPTTSKDKDKTKSKNTVKNAVAQEDTIIEPPRYTYAAERRYNVIHELNGEEFIPGQYQPNQNDVLALAPGDVIVRIMPQKIMIQGIPNLSSFQILSKAVDRVGFVYEMMDNKGQPARFKVVLDQDKYVNLLYLYSKTLGEHTFYLLEKTKEERAAELNYFTPKNDLFIRAYQNLLEKTIHPYSMVEDYTLDTRPVNFKVSDNIGLTFGEFSIGTPRGTFDIKKANTYAYNMDDFPSVRSCIEIQTKGKPGKVLIFLNFKQQIEFIQVENTRYFLAP